MNTYTFKDNEELTIITIKTEETYEEVMDFLCRTYGTEYVADNFEEVR